MIARWLAALILACGTGPLMAQGFAGLGTDAEGFAVPERGRALVFPADHGPHPAYRIEWWYLTATLDGDDGRAYGIQWTLFRSALRPEDGDGWDAPQLWMGHAGLTTPDAHFVAERLSRGGIGQAGAQAAPFRAWIDDWHMTGTADQGIDRLQVAARGSDFSYDLELEAEGPLVLHGEAGHSVKSAAGQASYYYSQPAYRISGRLDLPSGAVAVTGSGWLDREWSSQPLADDQSGWDWFSLSFDSGDRMMAFRLRDSGAGFTSGTWIAADGAVRPFTDGALAVAPLDTAAVAGRTVPVHWQLDLPSEGVSVEVEALNPQAWMATSVPYWEGPVTVTGSHSGRGYLEMTGYD